MSLLTTALAANYTISIHSYTTLLDEWREDWKNIRPIRIPAPTRGTQGPNWINSTDIGWLNKNLK